MAIMPMPLGFLSTSAAGKPSLPKSPSSSLMFVQPALIRPSHFKLRTAVTYATASDPTNKRVIVCDEKLKKMFGERDQVGFLEIARPISPHLAQCRDVLKVNASNVGVGSGGFVSDENDNQNLSSNGSKSESSSNIKKLPNQIPYPVSIALVLSGCALVFSIIAFGKGAPSTLLAAISKSGFTAAFTLIFVSEIGDKTFFIAALLAMQYDKTLVILGSMGALSLMTILSVIIGRIFNSVPAQFQTTLPIGEYAAVTLLMFFGLKAIKDAWDLPSSNAKNGEKNGIELDEFVEAEELVKEKASKQLKNPFEILWKSFSLVFFAEWGDRSMLATIALGAAQSPWGVASGAIAGHLLATTLAAVGGAFLANYISEKLVGYLSGVLFLLFAVATFLGVF